MDTAQHIWIRELIEGQFIHTDDAPSKLQTQDGRALSRVRIFGIVVSTNDIVVDDGTSSILVRNFDNTPAPPIGSPVLVIGRPRIYDNNPYVLGEIVKPCDPRWLDIRKRAHPLRKDPITLIRELDTGDGADYETAISKLGNRGEEIITHLLANGELFETKPGKLKILE